MYRIIVWSLCIVLFVTALFLGALQTPWAKNRIKELVFEIVQKEGLVLSMESLEGGPPFKWTLHNVLVQINKTDRMEMKTVYLRIAILPLLKRELSISYLYIDDAFLQYYPLKKEQPLAFSLPWAVSFESVKIENLRVKNLETEEEGLFALQGNGHLKRNGRAFSINAKTSSSDLTASIALVGNRKSNYIEGSFNLDIKSKQAFLPFASLPVDMSLSFETSLQGPWNVFPLKGEIKAKVEKLELPQLYGLDQRGFLEAGFTLFPDRSFNFSTFSLKTDLVCAKGEGKFYSSLLPKSIQASFLFPHLSRLIPHLGGILNGEVFYEGSQARFVFSSNQLEVGPVTYKDVQGKIEANLYPTRSQTWNFGLAKAPGFDDHKWVNIRNMDPFMIVESRELSLKPKSKFVAEWGIEDIWKGSGEFQAKHPDLPLDAKAEISLTPDRLLTIHALELNAPETAVRGDLSIFLPEKEVQGSLFAQVKDLKPYNLFAPELTGSFGGKIDFQGKNARLSALLRSFHLSEILSQELSIDCEAFDLFTDFKAKFSLEGKSTYLGPVFFDAFSFTTFWEKEAWPFTLQARGKWKDPLDFFVEGSWRKKEDFFDLYLSHLSGNVLQKPLLLQKPCSMRLCDKSLVITECRVDVGGGYLLGAVDLSSTLSKVHLKAEHFPLDLFAVSTSRFTLKGNSSLDISLEAGKENLQGRINLLLEDADIVQAGMRTPIQTKGSLQINFDREVAQIHGALLATDQQFLEFTGTLPTTYQLYPFQIGIDRFRPLYSELTMEGKLEEIFDFINIGSHRLSGLLSCHLFLSKNLASPQLQGSIHLQNGSYENYFIGLVLKEVQASLVANGETISLSSLQAKDEKEGSLTAVGKIDLKENLPYTFETQLENLCVLQLEWLSSSFTGPLQITGTTESALAKGEVVVSHADIKIPEELPYDIPALPITYVHEPVHLKKLAHRHETPFPFNYDTILNVPEKAFLTGRGLDCELEGNLHVIGRNITINGTGSLRLLKGKFSFAGKDFTLTQGELSFPSSYLNLSGTLAMPDLTVTALLRGPLTSPQLTFQSSPAMPTSSILAQILFNKDISELSAPQALQLADTIVGLSGGAGPGVLETIRKSLGIDRLNIGSSATDQVSVQIGKYLTKGVLVTLSQSTESSQVIVEVEFKGGFVLQAETQEDDQGKFSLKWNKNY